MILNPWAKTKKLKQQLAGYKLLAQEWSQEVNKVNTEKEELLRALDLIRESLLVTKQLLDNERIDHGRTRRQLEQCYGRSWII